MTKKPRTRPNVPGGAAKPPQAKGSQPGHNAGSGVTDAEQQRLALGFKTKFGDALALKKKYAKEFLDLTKKITAAGITVDQVKFMIECDTPEGEAAARALIAQQLQAAQWNNSKLGDQLGLFLEPDRTPSVDVAYDAGKFDSASNRPRKPNYDPSTEQYRSYMAGYDDHQRQLSGGFKAPGVDAHDLSKPQESAGEQQPAGRAAEQHNEADDAETQH